LKKKIITILQYLLFLLIGVALLWYCFRNQDITKIKSDLRHANYFWIAIALLCSLISHVIRAARWNLLITPLGYKTQLSTSFYAVMIGYLANMAIPRAGEISRCGVISKQNNIPFTPVFGTVIVERVFDLLCLIFILFLVVLFQWKFLGNFVSNNILHGLKTKISDYYILIFIVILFLAGLPFIYRIVIKPILKKMKIYHPIKNVYHDFITGIKSIKKIKELWLFILLSFFLWLFYTLSTYFCFFALVEISNLNFIDAITVMAIGSIGIVAPVPGGIGTYHYIITLLLSQLFLIDKNAALSFATIGHAAQVFLILILGGLSFLLLFFQQKTNLKNEKP